MDAWVLVGGSVVWAMKSTLFTLGFIIASILGLEIRDTDNPAVVKALDEMFQDGLCIQRAFGHSGLPSKGFCICRRGWLFLVGIRSGGRSPHWTLYGPRPAVQSVVTEIVGDPKDIPVKVISKIGYNANIMAVNEVPPTDVWPSSDAATDHIIELYESQGRASVVMCGPPGAGKSTLAIVLAAKLKKKKYIPRVYSGFDPSTPGVAWSQVIPRGYPQSPIIVTLDEFDKVIEYAQSRIEETGNRSGDNSHARNISTLHSFLDTLAKMQSLIIIATSNCSVTDDIWSVSARKGRFDEILPFEKTKEE